MFTSKKSKPQYHFQALKLTLRKNRLTPTKDGRKMEVLQRPASENVPYVDLLMVNSNPEVLVVY